MTQKYYFDEAEYTGPDLTNADRIYAKYSKDNLGVHKALEKRNEDTSKFSRFLVRAASKKGSEVYLFSMSSH